MPQNNKFNPITSLMCPHCFIYIDDKICHRCKRNALKDPDEVAMYNPYNKKNCSKPRQCLQCQKMIINSSWAGDRVCNSCKEKNLDSESATVYPCSIDISDEMN